MWYGTFFLNFISQCSVSNHTVPITILMQIYAEVTGVPSKDFVDLRTMPVSVSTVAHFLHVVCLL